MKNLFLTIILIFFHGVLFSIISIPPDSLINYPCNSNTFWTINTQGQIQEWSLNNNIVSGGQTILNTSSGWSLSYCGNSANQTFFSAGIGTINYYNGANWTTINDPLLNYCNSGGYKQFQYYVSGYNLYYYNGANLSFLFTGGFQVADLAVDTLGRAWTISGGSAAYSLSAVDSLGNNSVTYSCSNIIPTNNAYGMFFMNDTLYVGFGANNTQFPGKILPIIITGSTFHFGNPINFPETPYSFLDMASCMNNKNLIMTGISSIENHKQKIFPNPTSGILNIEYENVKRIEIYNSFGNKILVDELFVIKAIDLKEFDNGIYFIKITSGNTNFYEKIILSK